MLSRDDQAAIARHDDDLWRDDEEFEEEESECDQPGFDDMGWDY